MYKIEMVVNTMMLAFVIIIVIGAVICGYMVYKTKEFERMFGINPWPNAMDAQDIVNQVLRYRATMLIAIPSQLAGYKIYNQELARWMKKEFWRAHKIAKLFGLHVEDSWTDYHGIEAWQHVAVENAVHVTRKALSLR